MIRNITLSILAISAIAFNAKAQENKTIKEETTIQKTVVKEGSEVKVKEVAKVKTESGAVIVEGTNELNQEFREAIKVDDADKVLVNETKMDMGNESMVMAVKNRQSEELRKSIEAQKAEAEKQRQMLMDKQKQLQAELEARRMELENRPKGIAKLSRNRDN